MPTLIRPEDAAQSDVAINAGTAAPPIPSRALHERQLYIAGTVLIALVILASAALVTAIRERAIQVRLTTLSNLALVLAEQTERSFQAIDLVQRGIDELVSDLGVDDVRSLAAAMSSQHVHENLRERISGLPFIDAVSIFNENGILVATSRVWPAPPADVSDRAYFRELRRPGGPIFTVSTPLVGRLSGRPNVFVTRSIFSPHGQFIGAINVALDVGQIERTFSLIDLGADDLIALLRKDGTLLARYPEMKAAEGQADTDTERVARALAELAPGRGYLPAGVLDDHSRYAVLHELSRFPVSIVVSQTTAEIDGKIQEIQLPIIFTALLLCTLIALLAAFFARQIRSARVFSAFEHEQARRDVLTGLPNRLSFAEDLARLVADKSAPFALLFLDLDYFKGVNDTLGHEVGDALIRAVAARMRSEVGARGTIARVGGDEFGVVHTHIGVEDDATDLAREIIRAVRKPFFIGHHRILIGCTVGIALYPRDGDTVLSLLKSADLALYEAKGFGRGTARVYTPSLGQSSQERHRLQLDLNEAWRQSQFSLSYQPIFETCTRRLAGFEALLRWNHPERGPVRPDIFVPLAEDSGLIVPLGAWVLEEACRVAAQWPGNLFVSVNMSPVQFRGASGQEQVFSALERSGLPAARLEVEITESTLLLDGLAVTEAITDLRAIGVAIALDDFGTGYSSLSYLKTLSISRVKVDRSFIEHVSSDPHDLAIVQAVLRLSRALALKSTAEGIETEEQIACVQQEGCTHLQGYLLGRPMSAEEAGRLAQAEMV